jgi:hypothetical protein
MRRACDCGQTFDLAAFLDGLPRDGIASSGMVAHSCPGCGRSVELRLRNGGFDVGYTYFGGSLHFETLKEVRVPGLRVVPSDPDDLDVWLGPRRWHFGWDRPSRLRFAVLSSAFAAGKRLGDLDFDQLQVVVEAVERVGERLAPDRNFLLAESDFLHLRGAGPALTRAWHYMNDGRGRRS